MYLTYDEYMNMGGTLEETTFDNLEFEAEIVINNRTFNRLTKDTSFPMSVKRLVYKIIELQNLKNGAMSLGKTSDVTPLYITAQSNDGVSVKYNVASSESIISDADKEISKAIEKYLFNVENQAGRNLLYRGVYPGE